MDILNFEQVKKENWCVQVLNDFVVSHSEGFVFRLTVERARQYIDLTTNYLEVAFITEKCFLYANRISYNFDWSVGYHPVADLELAATDNDMLSE